VKATRLLWRSLTGVAVCGAYLYALGLSFFGVALGLEHMPTLGMFFLAFLTTTAAGLIVAVRIVVRTPGTLWPLVLGVASLVCALLLLLAVIGVGVGAANLLGIYYDYPTSVLLLLGSLAILNRVLRRRWLLTRTSRPASVTS
jgi:hypothetical protein